MNELLNPTSLISLVTALCTGAGGTWLAFKQFHVNRAKTSFEIEASLRTELRADIEKYREDTEELRNKVTKLFEENLELKHTNSNLMQQVRALSAKIDKMNNEKSSGKKEKGIKGPSKNRHKQVKKDEN